VFRVVLNYLSRKTKTFKESLTQWQELGSHMAP
jgi:hypothetical protein